MSRSYSLYRLGALPFELTLTLPLILCPAQAVHLAPSGKVGIGTIPQAKPLAQRTVLLCARVLVLRPVFYRRRGTSPS